MSVPWVKFPYFLRSSVEKLGVGWFGHDLLLVEILIFEVDFDES